MITIFTPVHKYVPKFFDELYQSLNTQTKKDFEWLILVNGPAIEDVDKIRQHAPWARVEVAFVTGNIGLLKGICCQRAKGDILVEVDYDDVLTEDAVEKIEAAFADPSVMFAYSNSVEFVDTLESGNYKLYGEVYGWHARPYKQWYQQVAFPESAHYLRRIEWTPNHVRCFRKEAYDKIGGYDKEVKVGDDHDLVCRMYLEFGAKGFKHIDDCLYFYRVHSDNTCNGSNLNKEIQEQVDKNYVKHAEPMYLKWAADEGLLSLDLGGRFSCPPGYFSVDLLDADYIVDLNKPWPFEDNSVGVLRAYHVLEHLDDAIHFFNEAFRVLAPGGFLLIEVPSVKGDGAFGDPTHKLYFNLLSFEYYTNERYAKFIRPQFKGKFQKARVVEYWWNDPEIPVISAQLIALKGWYDERWCGERRI